MASESADRFDAGLLLAAGLAHVVHVEEAGSTMDLARRLAGDPAAPLPLAVVVDRQTSGRGRRGAGWWQAPGSLATSLVVAGQPETAGAGPTPNWSLACGVAVAEAIRRLEPGVAAVVRWPNDVEVEGRKLAGMLVETVAGGRAIFGIGVNSAGSAALAPAAIRERIVTLPDLTGRSLPRRRLLAEIVPRLFGLLAELATDPAAVVGRYRPLCSLTDRPVTVHVGGRRHTGLCRGIDAEGRLVVETAAGRQRFASGSLTPPEDVWPGGG